MNAEVRSEISPELAAQALRMADDIRSGRLGPERHAEVVALIGKLTETTLEWFFIRPLDSLGVGFALRSAVKLGLASASRAIRIGFGQVIPKIHRDHWTKLADYLEESVRRPE
ncbi:MAG: hypothetical protein EPN72_03945 [Nevskiaceae bacterium]|nr:MAG: hypothetical protein EPN63_06725 [Nevskiaceae bacterium]TBR73973.1 MAG: hypothetical protein EPN72_03945 [Nevskiaceae bacterium]